MRLVAVRRGWGAVLCVLLALSAGGCGRRGRLEPAPDPDHPFALGTPRPAAEPVEGRKAQAPRRPKNPPIAKPDDPFILDPML